MRSLTLPCKLNLHELCCIVVESKLPELLKVRVKYRDQGCSDLSGKKTCVCFVFGHCLIGKIGPEIVTSTDLKVVIC